MGALQTDDFTITMPALACSFPLKVHPEAPHLIEVGNGFLLDSCRRIAAACESIELAGKLFSSDHNISSGFSLLATLFFANANSTQRVLPILKLMNWYFLIDTCVDEPGLLGAKPTEAALIIDSVLALFMPRSPPHDDQSLGCGNVPRRASSSSPHAHHITQELAHILTSDAAEWWSDMRVDMPLSQQARFSEAFKGYLSSIKKEAPFRSACTLPDVQGYLHLRSQTIGWYPVALLTEYTLCMELEEDAITHPLLLALKKAVNEAVFLANDIMSFCKEYERGDTFNIIIILCFQKMKASRLTSSCHMHVSTEVKLPSTWLVELATPELLQESMNEACKMLMERDGRCVCLIEKIRGTPELMEKPGMGAFLEAMGNYVSSNLYWHLISGRYWQWSPHYDFENSKSPDEIVKVGMARVLASRKLLLKPPRLAHILNGH